MGGLVVAVPAGSWTTVEVLVPRALVVPTRVRADRRETPAKYGLSFETLDVRTAEGYLLKGWFVPAAAEKAKGTVVVLHGKSSCKEHMVILARLLAPAGYHTIIHDSRAHGESGGTYCTYGVREREDVIRCRDEARRKFGDLGPVGIIGTSFGAAVAVEVLAAHPEFRCGILCGPFCRLEEAAKKQFEDVVRLSWPRWLDRGLRRGEEWADFNVSDIAPERSAARVGCPALVIHGEHDRRFPVEWGRRLFESLPSPEKEWHLARGNGHDDVFWHHDAENTKRTMVRFLDRHLGSG
jgi:pimeloyl-ACP methyl ester carboxylesterase